MVTHGFAFSALNFSLNAIKSEPACLMLRKAGLARTVFSVLSHPSMCCRTFAVMLCTWRNRELMVELREAGIVHALMEVLRDDTGGGSRQNLPDTGSFTRRAIQVQGSSGAAVTVGFDKPSFAVCHALLAMQDTVRPIALDIVTAPGFAPALVHSYKIFPSEMLLGPAHLLAAVVQALKSDSRHESLRCAMANELISAGLLETLSSVLNPTWERLSNPILFAFTTIVEWAGFVGMPADILSQNTACLINFIRCCRDEVDASSAEVLLQLVSLAASRSRPSGCCHSRLQVLEALVKNLVGFMNTGKPTLAIHAVPIVVHRVQAHKELINMAVDSGFIRGMLRLLQLVRIGAEESTDEGEMFSTGGAVMYRGVLDFLAFAKEGHVTEALTSGLVAELKACVTGDVTAQQWFVMQTCELLLVLWGLRGPAAKLRESGIVPGILVKVANGSNNEGVLAFADWLGKLSQSKVKRAKVFVAELLAAGALEKLTQSSLATSENHVTLGSILQELQRFALRNHGEVKRARSRVTGDGSPRGSRKQEVLQLCEKASAAAASEHDLAAAGKGCSQPSNALWPVRMGSKAKPERAASKGALRAAATVKVGPWKKTCAVCAQCGKNGGGGVKLQSCAGCLEVAYCGRDCQRSH